jgi:hypothetical protein
LVCRNARNCASTSPHKKLMRELASGNSSGMLGALIGTTLGLDQTTIKSKSRRLPQDDLSKSVLCSSRETRGMKFTL